MIRARQVSDSSPIGGYDDGQTNAIDYRGFVLSWPLPRVHATGRTTVDPNTIKKPGQAVPAEVKDKRLDQKIEYDAGNARLHKVIDDLAKMSGVTIYCGKDDDDWQPRDIPVSVASRGITLRKLLNALRCLATRHRLEVGQDKGMYCFQKIDRMDANQNAESTTGLKQ